MQAWAKRRTVQAGLPVPSSVHMISSTKQFGVKELLSELQKAAGTAGDVWVVGPPSAPRLLAIIQSVFVAFCRASAVGP